MILTRIELYQANKVRANVSSVLVRGKSDLPISRNLANLEAFHYIFDHSHVSHIIIVSMYPVLYPPHPDPADRLNSTSFEIGNQQRRSGNQGNRRSHAGFGVVQSRTDFAQTSRSCIRPHISRDISHQRSRASQGGHC
jgi:hypothetical protein